MNTNINTLIAKKRIEINMTQVELAKILDCSRTHLCKMENGERNISESNLITISKTLNFDFVSLNKNTHNFKNLKHYLLTHKLIDTIESKNFIAMSTLLNDKIVQNSFNYGIPLLIKLFCTASIQYNKGNFNKAIEICIEILNIDFNNIDNFQLEQYKNYRYYSTILILEASLCKVGKINSSKILLENTITFLEVNFFNDNLPFSFIDHFYKRFYINILNNYADTLFILKDNKNALDCCNKAISFANEHNISFLMDLLLKLKIEILYNLNKIDEAKKTYFHFVAICELKENIEYLEKTKRLIEEKYPLILN